MRKNKNYRRGTSFTIVTGLCLTAGFFAWKLVLAGRFTAQVKTLFSLSKGFSGKKFSYGQLEGLPSPVQRYFKHVIKDGQPYINSARLMHDGQFRAGLDKDWADIAGQQYFTTGTPGFIWKGKTSQFTAIDQYVDGKGSLQVFLMSIVRIANGSGEKYNQGELQRWLCESVWFPTNLLPGEQLQWSAIDDHTATLAFTNEGQTVSFVVTFNQANEIVQMETRRYLGESGLENWVTKMSDYQELNGVKIPATAEALWRLAGGDISYARFHVKRLEYEIGKEF